MTTRVVVIRHAKPLNGGYADDSLRPLSDEGKETQKKLALLLKREGFTPTLILSSPLLRAKQSAEILADVFGTSYEEEPALGEAFDPEHILKLLSHPKENATIFLVGHAPTLAEFVHAVVGSNVLPSGLSKSSAAIIDFDEAIAFSKGKFIRYYPTPF